MKKITKYIFFLTVFLMFLSSFTKEKPSQEREEFPENLVETNNKKLKYELAVDNLNLLPNYEVDKNLIEKQEVQHNYTYNTTRRKIIKKSYNASFYKIYALD